MFTKLLCFFGVIFTMGCTSFGTSPSSESKEIFKKSSHYDVTSGKFINRKKDALAEMRKRSMNFSSISEFFFGGSESRVPDYKLPEVKPDFKKFLEASSEIKIIWFGHSSLILNLNQRIILIDPVLSNSTGPFGFMMKRFQQSVVELKDLPDVDYILISHDHYDHLDMDTIKYFIDKKTKFVTPLGVGSHLIGWGIAADRIQELDWWQNTQVEDLNFVATPAQHFSGRTFLDSEKTLWASWVIKNKDHSIYFSGDSGFDTHFKDIGEKFGPFDLAFIEDGQYNEKWREVHMLPEESIQAFKDLNAKVYFPIHWGMFNLSLHSWHEPIEKITELASKQNISILTPQIGELTSLKSNFHSEKWWKRK